MEHGYLGGVAFPRAGEDVLLVAVTERRTREQIDGLVAADGSGDRVTAIGAPIRRQGPGGDGTILDRSVAGRRAWSLPPLDVPEAPIAAEHARSEPPDLPGGGRGGPRAPLHAVWRR